MVIAPYVTWLTIVTEGGTHRQSPNATVYLIILRSSTVIFLRFDRFRIKYNSQILAGKQKQRCGWLGLFKTVKTFLIVLEVNSGAGTVRINTMYDTFLLKTVSFQWVAQPVQSLHYRYHLLPAWNEYIKYVYPRHMRFHANWLSAWAEETTYL